MNKFVAILVVVVVGQAATLASGASVDSSTAQQQQQQQQQADFVGLAKYLASSDATRLKANINSLDGGVKRAAQLYVKLSEAQDCNDDVLLMAREATKSGLMESIAKPETAAAMKPLVPKLNKLLNECVTYIDDQTESRVSSTDQNMNRFLTSVSPLYNEWSDDSNAWNPILQVNDAERAPRMQLQVDDTTAIPYFEIPPVSHSEVHYYLTRLVRTMGLNDTKESVGDAEVAFQKYFVEPCRQFEQTFGPLFEGSKALETMMGRHRVMLHQNTQSISLASTHNTCEGVLLLAQDDSASQEELGFTKAVVVQALAPWVADYSLTMSNVRANSL